MKFENKYFESLIILLRFYFNILRNIYHFVDDRVKT